MNCSKCENTTFHYHIEHATLDHYVACTKCKFMTLIVEDSQILRKKIELEELMVWTLEQLDYFKMAESKQVRDHSEEIQTYIHAKIDQIQKNGL